LLDVGADYEGPGLYDVDYTVADAVLGEGLIVSPVLNYSPALRMKAHAGTQVLAHIHEPYFSRTYEHYCSHMNTPYRPERAAHPALIQKGRVVYSPSPLDLMYDHRAARAHRDLFERALKRVYTAPMLHVALPSNGRVSLLHQAAQHRYVAHLLYATPHYRGGLELIEDLVPLFDVPVVLHVSELVRKATLIPDGIDLPLVREGETVKVVVPRFTMHCAVVFET
jgi:hypothetical protein